MLLPWIVLVAALTSQVSGSPLGNSQHPDIRNETLEGHGVNGSEVDTFPVPLASTCRGKCDQSTAKHLYSLRLDRAAQLPESGLKQSEESNSTIPEGGIPANSSEQEKDGAGHADEEHADHPGHAEHEGHVMKIDEPKKNQDSQETSTSPVKMNARLRRDDGQEKQPSNGETQTNNAMNHASGKSKKPQRTSLTPSTKNVHNTKTSRPKRNVQSDETAKAIYDTQIAMGYIDSEIVPAIRYIARQLIRVMWCYHSNKCYPVGNYEQLQGPSTYTPIEVSTQSEEEVMTEDNMELMKNVHASTHPSECVYMKLKDLTRDSAPVEFQLKDEEDSQTLDSSTPEGLKAIKNVHSPHRVRRASRPENDESPHTSCSHSELNTDAAHSTPCGCGNQNCTHHCDTSGGECCRGAGHDSKNNESTKEEDNKSGTEKLEQGGGNGPITPIMHFQRKRDSDDEGVDYEQAQKQIEITAKVHNMMESFLTSFISDVQQKQDTKLDAAVMKLLSNTLMCIFKGHIENSRKFMGLPLLLQEHFIIKSDLECIKAMLETFVRRGPSTVKLQYQVHKRDSPSNSNTTELENTKNDTKVPKKMKREANNATENEEILRTGNNADVNVSNVPTLKHLHTENENIGDTDVEKRALNRNTVKPQAPLKVRVNATKTQQKPKNSTARNITTVSKTNRKGKVTPPPRHAKREINKPRLLTDSDFNQGKKVFDAYLEEVLREKEFGDMEGMPELPQILGRSISGQEPEPLTVVPGEDKEEVDADVSDDEAVEDTEEREERSNANSNKGCDSDCLKRDIPKEISGAAAKVIKEAKHAEAVAKKIYKQLG